LLYRLLRPGILQQLEWLTFSIHRYGFAGVMLVLYRSEKSPGSYFLHVSLEGLGRRLGLFLLKHNGYLVVVNSLGELG
jgi:hypothetical protein